jgi:hypothetical protein
MRVETMPVSGPAGVVAPLEVARTTPDIAYAHARLLRDSDLQFDRTGFTAPDIPRWFHWIGDALQWIAPALKYVFWGGLILIGGLILFAVGREFLKLRGPRARTTKAPTPIDPEWRPDAAAARDLLASADSLAAEGRFAEAAHLLLLRSVEDIQKRQPKALRVSLTTREIATLKAIPEGARPAFVRIGHVVERSLFGSAAVGAADFADCRQAYEAFALPEGWRR